MVRIHPDPPTGLTGNPLSMYVTGGLAQLGEHLLCKQGVVGSIPSSSTNPQCAGFCRKQSVAHWRLSQSERGEATHHRLSFFNNQEEVVKRFTKAYLEMGA
jgi:hypothetical protein